MIYDQELPEEEFRDLMTIPQFLDSVENGFITDWDGYGKAVKGDKMSRTTIAPSRKGRDIPKDATHICWFNK